MTHGPHLSPTERCVLHRSTQAERQAHRHGQMHEHACSPSCLPFALEEDRIRKGVGRRQVFRRGATSAPELQFRIAATIVRMQSTPDPMLLFFERLGRLMRRRANSRYCMPSIRGANSSAQTLGVSLPTCFRTIRRSESTKNVSGAPYTPRSTPNDPSRSSTSNT